MSENSRATEAKLTNGTSVHLVDYAMRLLLLGVLALHSFPGQYDKMDTFFEASYQWAFNFLDNSSYVWGADAFYTYGPLGYLLWPLDVGNNLWHAMLFRVIVHIVFVACAALFIFRAKSLWYPVSFLIAYCAIPPLGLSYEYQLLIVQVLISAACLEMPGRRGAILSVMAGAFAAMLLFMKFNMGVTAASIAFLFPLTSMRSHPRPTLLALAATVAGYSLSLLLLALVYLKTPANALLWLRETIAVAGDYSDAMCEYEHKWSFPISMGCIGLYLLICAWLAWSKSRIFGIALALLPAVFFAYKHANVRQVPLNLSHMFFVCLMFFAVFMLLLGLRRERLRYVLAAYGCVLTLYLAMAIWPEDKRVPDRFMPDILGTTGAKNLATLFRFDDVRARLAEESKKALAADALPSGWLDIIKASNGTVDTIPWENSYIPANNLQYIPNPAVQLYNAYTLELDANTAAHFDSDERAPTFLIFDYDPNYLGVDRRYPFWDPPKTMNTILRHYQAISINNGAKPRLLLQRLATPRQEEPAAFKTQDVRKNDAGKPLDPSKDALMPPQSGKRLWVSFDMNLTLWGQIRKFLYRVPSVHIKVLTEDGKMSLHRIIPNLARQPMIFDYMPRDAEGAAALFLGQPRAQDRIKAFVLDGPGLPFYSQVTTATWYQ